mgnify:CR=1 FL=1
MAIIRTDEELETEIGKLAGGQQGGVPQVEASLQDTPDPTIQGTQDTILGTTPTAPTTVATPDNVRPDVPTQPQGTGQLTQPQSFIQPNIGTMDSAQIAERTYVGDIQGTVSQGSLATAPTPELDEKATTRFQLKELLSSLDEGTDVPSWASPAVRKVSAIMQARGLGSSTMLAEAMAEGILRSSIPIAQADANTYKQVIFQNLANNQQAAVINAQAYLQMDMANLSNNQQANLQNLQAQQQQLLTDNAARNAALQFNATSQNQVNQFYDKLSTTISDQNAARTDGMNKFAEAERAKASALNAQNTIAVNEANAKREAALNQYNATLENQRQQFNVNNQKEIDQSNVVWRRAINTANTASVNAANQTNAQNLLNLSNWALSSLWQQWRDEASWINTSSTNEANRNHNLAMAALERSTAFELQDQASKDALYQLIGKFGFSLL